MRASGFENQLSTRWRFVLVLPQQTLHEELPRLSLAKNAWQTGWFFVDVTGTGTKCSAARANEKVRIQRGCQRDQFPARQIEHGAGGNRMILRYPVTAHQHQAADTQRLQTQQVTLERTAVAVAAHEVGHAIQFCRKEPISQLRSKYLRKAFIVQRIGSRTVAFLVLLSLVMRTPYLLILTAVIGVATQIASALMYAAMLPEEYDASFRKALPILEEGYVQNVQIFAARQVLRAAALTYVAGAIANILNLWRWIRVLR